MHACIHLLSADLNLLETIENFLWRLYQMWNPFYNKIKRSFFSLSLCRQSAGDQESLNTMLKEMGVEDAGQGVSFENFWNLVNSFATSQCGLLQKDKKVHCSCLLLWDPDHLHSPDTPWNPSEPLNWRARHYQQGNSCHAVKKYLHP